MSEDVVHKQIQIQKYWKQALIVVHIKQIR